jgi:hypothetical protein
MKSLIVLVLATMSSGAFANSAPLLDTTDYTCQELRSFVRVNRQRDFTTEGENRRTYYSDFYGNGDGVCSGSKRAVTGWATSSSGKQCPIGYVCVDRD